MYLFFPTCSTPPLYQRERTAQTRHTARDRVARVSRDYRPATRVPAVKSKYQVPYETRRSPFAVYGPTARIRLYCIRCIAEAAFRV